MSEREPILFVLSAPSGTGKSSLVARLVEQAGRLRFSVSHNTRPARPGEREGIDYHFVDRATFEALAAQEAFLEWAEVHGDMKGTALHELARARHEGVDLLLDLDVQGAAQVRRRYPSAVSVFVLPPSRQELERRLRGRAQDSQGAISRRLADARREIRRWNEFDYVVINDHLDSALDALLAVVRAERQRRGHMEAGARRIAASFEELPEEENPEQDNPGEDK